MRFFRLIEPADMPVHVGADSLRKPHHIATLLFSEVVNGHPKYYQKKMSNIVSMYIQQNWRLFSFIINKKNNLWSSRPHDQALVGT